MEVARRVLSIALVAVSSACSLIPMPSPTCNPEERPCGQAWIVVDGRWAQQGYLLEVANLAWQLGEGGGLASFEIIEDERALVRIVQPRDCTVLVEWAVTGGTIWHVDFERLPTPVADWSDRGDALDSGPSLPEAANSDCPWV